MKKLVIRADDLGYSEGINYGIEKSVKDGLAESVGVMTNMPTVQHGLNLLANTDVCLGQHTNICIGKPITDPSLIPSIIGENGEFKASKVYREAKEDFVVLDEVILEIEAQYHRFIELVGSPPQYFEGHAIASTNFFKGLEIVAEKYGLKYSPFPLDGNSIKVGNSTVLVNMEATLKDYNPFEALKRTVEMTEADGVGVFVTHPGYLDGYILKNSSLTTPRPLEVDMLCNPHTKKWLEVNEVDLINYNDL